MSLHVRCLHLTKFILMLCAAPLAIATVQMSFGQGTVTFDGSPNVPRGSSVYVQSYSESGFYFTPLAGSSGFVRQGGGPSLYPDNRTAYLQATVGDSVGFSNLNGDTFSVTAVDLAGYSTVVPNVTAYFTGYRQDGSSITTNFAAGGINFQTYYFGPQWSGLLRVEVPDFGSMDNLVVFVPEPGPLGFLLTAMLAGWRARSMVNKWSRRRRAPLKNKKKEGAWCRVL